MGGRALSGVEELLWLLDAPREPQTLRLELALPATPDHARLRVAAQRVLAARPHARARLDPWGAETRALKWCVPREADDDPVLVLEGEHPGEALVGRPLSLDRSPGWRLGVAPGRLLLCAHHALFDLGSGIRLLGDLAAAYRDPDVELPVDPGRPAGEVADRASLPQRAAFAARVARRLVAPATHLAPVPTTGTGGYVLTERHVDLSVLDHRCRAAVARTDLIVAAGHRAIASFNAARGASDARIVLLTAIGTARARVRPRPIENAWVATTNETRPREREDARGLLNCIADQRRRARDRDAPALAAALQEASSAPVFAKRLAGALHPLTRHRLEETAALTYLGEVDAFDFGPAGRSTALVLDGPARAPKGLFIGAVAHERTLCLGYRGSAAQLNRPALEQLADAHVTELRALGCDASVRS